MMLWSFILPTLCTSVFIVGNQCCQISTVSRDVVVELDHTLVLNCSTSSHSHNKTTFTWSHNEKEISNKMSIFTKYNVTQADAGKYHCSLGGESCSVVINVNSPPLVSLGICEELQGNMKLYCHISTYPTPNVTWYKDGRKLNLGSENDKVKYFVENGSPHNGNGQKYVSILKKYHPDISDGNGTFTCLAENRNGNNSASQTHCCGIAMRCAEFVNKNTSVTVNVHVGDSITLLCEIIFYNKRASCGKRDVPNFNRINKNRGSNHVVTVRDAGDTPPLVLNYTIVNATRNDSGIYQCFYWSNQNSKCNALIKNISVQIKDTRLDSMSSRSKRNVYIIAGVCVAGALLGLALALLVLRHRRLHRNILLNESCVEVHWDVFVSYSSEDFVWVRDLCSMLEAAPFNLVVCLHHRDWELGRAIVDNMVDSVYCSRKTLIVMSKSYVKSSYCMQELQIALHSELGDKDRILLIKLDDVSMNKLPRALRQKSFLDCSDREQLRHFKTKLLRALPQRETTGIPEDDDGEDDGEDDGDVNNQFKLEEISLV